MKAADFRGIAVVVAFPGSPLPPHQVTDWSDDSDAFTFKRRAQSVTDKVGVDGKMAIFLSADKSAEFGLKLFATSPSNKYLNTGLQLQDGGQKTFCPVSITFMDTNRQDKLVGVFGYIKQVPDISRGSEVKMQEWTLIVERGTALFGDPDFAAFLTAAAEGQ
jgi:hypothetical protein